MRAPSPADTSVAFVLVLLLVFIIIIITIFPDSLDRQRVGPNLAETPEGPFESRRLRCRPIPVCVPVGYLFLFFPFAFRSVVNGRSGPFGQRAVHSIWVNALYRSRLRQYSHTRVIRTPVCIITSSQNDRSQRRFRLFADPSYRAVRRIVCNFDAFYCGRNLTDRVQWRRYRLA